MARSTRVKTGLVEVEGLAGLSKALKGMDPEMRKALRATNKDVAETESDHARSLALSIGGVAAKTAPSIRPAVGLTSAGLAFGGAAYPFAGGAEFGALKYPQFQPWRGNDSSAGYFVYPTIRRDADDIADTYIDAVNDLIQRAFPIET